MDRANEAPPSGATLGALHIVDEGGDSSPLKLLGVEELERVSRC